MYTTHCTPRNTSGPARLLKVLTPTGHAPYQGTRWFLPSPRRAGRWMPPLAGRARVCDWGYHGTTLFGLHQWWLRPAQRVFVAEVDGPVQVEAGSSKWVTTAPVRLVHEVPTGDLAARFLALHVFHAADAQNRWMPAHHLDWAARWEWALDGRDTSQCWHPLGLHSPAAVVRAALNTALYLPDGGAALFRTWWEGLL